MPALLPHQIIAFSQKFDEPFMPDYQYANPWLGKKDPKNKGKKDPPKPSQKL